ncbi:hypothetical protein LR48_Vigan04g044100 [Vigna angularis]|uniref:MER3 helicase-like winged helix domain-containing protein n=1 Tax=Phaseolus angularis TaxID=3914 RepID=A0A0L9UBU8_PHAAN|nr:hypothetical protein LR48_Vigan04g044100 [Vigna angularis]
MSCPNDVDRKSCHSYVDRKGTEYYDGKAKRYVDFPITDILQMMGRAGRPQFDQHGKAVILVHEPKKSFYKKFLYEPFPVESSLREHLHNHINAEIISGTICHKQDAVHYLTWTYLFRRLVKNGSQFQPTKFPRVIHLLSRTHKSRPCHRQVRRCHDSRDVSSNRERCHCCEVCQFLLFHRWEGLHNEATRGTTMRGVIVKGVLARVVAIGVVVGRGAIVSDISAY